MADEDKVLELDNNFRLTPEQVLERCRRIGFTEVIVIGMSPDGVLDIFGSDKITSSRGVWLASRAAATFLDLPYE